MSFPKINWLAVVVVVIVWMVLGFVWYEVLFKTSWQEHVGLTDADFENASPMPFVFSILSAVLISIMITWLLQLSGQSGAGAGAKWGAIVWFLVVLPYALTTDAFTLYSPGLSLIEAGKDLVGFVLAGVILGAWPPKAS